MIERTLYTIFVFFLIIYAPYWLYIPAILFGIIIFPVYTESIVLSLIIDYFYGPHIHTGSLFSYPFAITAALIVLASIQLKERFRFSL